MSAVIQLPVAGAVMPAPGVGVTFHSLLGIVPGTIVRAGPRIFWFRVDDGFPGGAQLSETFRGWTHSAVLQPDGVWRAGAEMMRVDVGVRRWRRSGPAPTSEADKLAAALEGLEPRLLQRRWYPMTYMGIPSMLHAADDLLERMAAYDGPERERVATLHEKLAHLRKDFRNVGGGLRSAATEDLAGECLDAGASGGRR
ncbi:MAG TPA: hypothetical protein VD838_19020 [Anaeromyxobacteraceae bacterium]|nr:hypothetical protein [Anaeromyxobacteraceae bacterium]